MEKPKYELRYLPLFYDDLWHKINYIKVELQNPQAAIKLLHSVEQAILARQPFAESFEQYHSLRERRYPYYRICVHNYVIYYVVIADEGPTKIMELRRFLYKRQNRDRLL